MHFKIWGPRANTYHIGKTGTLAAALCILAEPARFDSSLSDPRPPLESCSSFFEGTQTLSLQSCAFCGPSPLRFQPERSICWIVSVWLSDAPTWPLLGLISISIQLSPVQSKTGQFSPIHFNSVQFSPTQSNSIQVSPIQSNSVQFSPIQSNSIQFSPIQSNSVQVNSIQFSPIQSTSVQFNSIESSSVQFSPNQSNSTQFNSA